MRIKDFYNDTKVLLDKENQVIVLKHCPTGQTLTLPKFKHFDFSVKKIIKMYGGCLYMRLLSLQNKVKKQKEMANEILGIDG